MSIVTIVDYRTEHRDAFRELNLEWISRYFVVEPSDRQVLDDPEREILQIGGAILVAEAEGRVVGCCALIPLGNGVLELAKMAVSPAAQGKGIGWLLGRASIDRARALGAHQIELVSNRSLAPALSLYCKLGFVEAPLGHTEYTRADIRMVLTLND